MEHQVYGESCWDDGKLANHQNNIPIGNASSPSKKTEYLNINSRSRDRGTAESFYIDVQRQENLRRIKLASAELPNVNYAFCATRGNNTFIFDDGTAWTITIPEGTYTATDLALQLESQLQTTTGNASITVAIDVGSTGNPTTLKMTITSNATFDVTTAKTGTTQQQAIRYNIGDMLGLPPFDASGAVQTYTATSVGPNFVLVSPCAIKLSGIDYMFINIANLPGYITDSNNIITSFKVPLRSSFGEIEYYTNNVEYNSVLFNYDNQTTINHLEVQLVAPWGEVIDNNCAEWSFMLELEYY